MSPRRRESAAGGHPRTNGPERAASAGRVRVAASDATTGASSGMVGVCSSSSWCTLACAVRMAADEGRSLRRFRRSAGRESPDQRCVGPSGPELHWRCGEGPVILGNRVREIVGTSAMSHAWLAARSRWSQSRNPTAVQSGNRSATPILGERPRETIAGNRLCELFRKERLTLSGPRRAQAGSNLPTASARDQRSATYVGGSPPQGGWKPMKPTDRPTDRKSVV